jgi:hypothetical protein
MGGVMAASQRHLDMLFMCQLVFNCNAGMYVLCHQAMS